MPFIVRDQPSFRKAVHEEESILYSEANRQRWIAADEAAAEGDEQTVITVPTALLPEIRRLLASHKSA